MVRWTEGERKGERPCSRAESGGTSDTRAFPCGQVREECSPRHEAFAVGDRPPQDRRQQPVGDNLNSRYILKLVPRDGARQAAECAGTPPPNITSSRLAVLVKMASENNCYLEWQDSLASTATPLSSTPSSRIASQGPDVGQGMRNLPLPMGCLGPGISSLPRPPGDLGSQNECHSSSQSRTEETLP